MNSRQFFTSHAWWGKLIGAFLGYLIGGPAGALFGILIGNFFDRGLTEHFSRPHWPYHAEKRPAVKATFLEATFSVMGHIAKADGQVTTQEIRMAKNLMSELELSYTQRQAAEDCFNEGKKSHFNLNKMLSLFYKTAYNNPTLLKLFIEIQYSAAQIDGLSFKKQEILNTILNHFGFASLNKQYRFYDDFSSSSNYQHTNQNYSSSSNHQQYQAPQNLLEHAYGILKIQPSANKQEVKRAYRQQMSQNHPDKLIAKGLPEEKIKLANEKTQKIRKAYEQICASKGW